MSSRDWFSASMRVPKRPLRFPVRTSTFLWAMGTLAPDFSHLTPIFFVFPTLIIRPTASANDSILCSFAWISESETTNRAKSSAKSRSASQDTATNVDSSLSWISRHIVYHKAKKNRRPHITLANTSFYVENMALLVLCLDAALEAFVTVADDIQNFFSEPVMFHYLVYHLAVHQIKCRAEINQTKTDIQLERHALL